MSRPADMLIDLERRWRPPLRSVSLVAELDVADVDVRAALRALGPLYDRAEGSERQLLLRHRFPACLVVGLAGIGALDYQHGNFWSRVWEETGLRGGPADQSLWGESFRRNLDRFGLARFKGLPQVKVSEILIHAGVPAYCLADLLNLLLRRQRQNPDLTATDLLSWASTPGRDSRLAGIDKPVQRFLLHGGDYAEDFVDRSLELLDRLRRPSFDADGLRLPPRVIGVARALAEDGVLELSQPRTFSGLRPASSDHPRLMLEAYGRGVMVWLPAVGEAPDGRAVWELLVDTDQQLVPSRALWPGASETAPATTAPLDRPVREVLARLAGSPQQFEIAVVEPTDLLLVFSDDGRRIPATAALTPEPVWLLHPAEVELDVELRGRGSLGELEEVPAPYGWGGWRLRRVDLREVAALRLGEGRWRHVQGARRARLELGAPLLGVRTVYDTPVFADTPPLTLPTEPGVSTGWSIRIRRSGSAHALSVRAVVIDNETTLDPWENLERPLVGPYEITVRGPLGRGLTRTLEFAEGLRVAIDPRWRELRPNGLVPASVRVGAGVPGLRMQPETVRLGLAEPTAQVTVSGRGCSEVLLITPPHMAVQRTGTGERSDWSLRPIRIATETVDVGQLLVRLPAPLPTELVVRVGGAELQRLPSNGSGGQPLARFDLAKLADTVRAHGIANLDLAFDHLRFPLGTCTPRRLADAVIVDEEGRLKLVNGAATDGLAAACYQVYAPWREPVALPIGRDHVSEPLPDHIRPAGPLVVQLRVEDPWLPTPWPDWPDRENAFALADRPWSRANLDDVEAELSGFLAGILALPTRPEVASYALRLYRWADELRRLGVERDVRDGVASMLAAHPAATLAAVLDARLSGADVVAPLVHAGLAFAPPVRYVGPDDELLLWAASPLAGVLASAHRLRREAVPVELREQVLAICGPAADLLLDGKPDPHAAVGSFDSTVQRLAVLPREQVDSIWRAARVVPGGLLDADGRAVAARELFDARDRPGIRRVAAQAPGLLAQIRALWVSRGDPALSQSVAARGSGTGWSASARGLARVGTGGPAGKP